MKKIKGLILLGLCVVFGACVLVMSQYSGEITVYLSPYQIDFGSMLLAEPNIMAFIDDNKLDVSLLHPELIGVTLVNTSKHTLRIPSYNRDAIGKAALYFELKDGSNIVCITRMPREERKAYVKKHLKNGVMNIRSHVCVEPGESIVLVPGFWQDEWANANEILVRKNDGNAWLRAVYEYYESSEDTISVFYSEWISLPKLIPYPLSHDVSEQKLVY